MKAVVIRLSAEKDEFALHHVLGLEPILGGTATIELLARLETMPSSPELGCCIEELKTITVAIIAEPDRGAGSGSTSFLRTASSGLTRPWTQGVTLCTRRRQLLLQCQSHLDRACGCVKGFQRHHSHCVESIRSGCDTAGSAPGAGYCYGIISFRRLSPALLSSLREVLRVKALQRVLKLLTFSLRYADAPALSAPVHEPPWPYQAEDFEPPLAMAEAAQHRTSQSGRLKCPRSEQA